MSTLTTNKNIIKPANGEFPDTWDSPVNTDWDIIDKSLGGSVSKTLSNSDVILTIDEAQNQQIFLSGSLTANVNVIIPFQSGSSTAAIGGQWIVYNSTSGAYSVSIITQVSGSVGVIAPRGFRSTVYSNQVNIAFSDDVRLNVGAGLTVTPGAPPIVSLTTPVAVSLGGTGNNNYSDGDLLIGNTATSGLTRAKLTAGANVTITNGNGIITIAAATGGGGGGGITSLTLSGGLTGLAVNGSSSATLNANGTFTLSGTLGVAFGGTGNTSLTGYVKGSGSAALTGVSSIPFNDVAGLGSMASQNSSSVSISGGIIGSGVTISATVANATNAVNATNATNATNVVGGAVSTNGVVSSGRVTAILGGGSSWTQATGRFVSQSDWGLEATATSGSPTNNGALICRINNVSDNMILFNYNGTTIVGSITTNGSMTTYGTSSDYRLKDNVQDFRNGSAIIKAIRPVSFTWADNPNAGVNHGVLAHELQSVFPEAVHGGKDALNIDGSASYQTADYSKLVILLVSSNQDILDRLERLEAA